jgi:hypothetical protein
MRTLTAFDIVTRTTKRDKSACIHLNPNNVGTFTHTNMHVLARSVLAYQTWLAGALLHHRFWVWSGTATLPRDHDSAPTHVDAQAYLSYLQAKMMRLRPLAVNTHPTLASRLFMIPLRLCA